MKKLILLIVFLLVSFASFAQWEQQTVESDFDGSFKASYVVSSQTQGMLILYQNEKKLDKPIAVMKGAYFCSEHIATEILLEVNGVKNKYTVISTKSKDNKRLYLPNSIWSDDFTSDFQNSQRMLIRVNMAHCGTEIYEFDMTDVQSAFNFIIQR